MSWSFKINNGDLDFSGPGGFAVVRGQQKLVQDLKHWLLEPRGTDPFHPDYGSTLDGGYFPDGSEVPSAIGGIFTGEDLLKIEAEIRRVLNSYRNQQVDRMNRESMKYGGRNTFSRGEILLTINAVNVSQLGDTALANISITTADGDEITFQQALS